MATGKGIVLEKIAINPVFTKRGINILAKCTWRLPKWWRRTI